MAYFTFVVSKAFIEEVDYIELWDSDELGKQNDDLGVNNNDELDEQVVLTKEELR